MTKQFYVQVDEVNRIIDVIETPHEGYQPVELEVPLPTGILGGAYELLEGGAVYRIQWDTKEQEREQRQEAAESAILGLMQMQLNQM